MLISEVMYSLLNMKETKLSQMLFAGVLSSKWVMIECSNMNFVGTMYRSL